MINIFLPQNSRRREFLKKLLIDPKPPAHISRNFTDLKDSDLNLVRISLETNYVAKEADGYLSTEVGMNDLMDHLMRRLEISRRYTIPWLDSVRSLNGARILEIGCGTGSSTVALAEQGESVTAIDVDERALIDARKRCEIYALNVDFCHVNSMEVARLFSGGMFDFIIFWACIEHMTHEERMVSMKETWDMLAPNGLWCVTGTPNRLWFYDSHTSEMPFFLWLPDGLAIRYSRFSPRQKFRESFARLDDEEEYMFRFLRWGRGLSFHEFELAMKPVDQLNIVSCMDMFYGKRRILSFLRWGTSLDYRYESFMHKLCPNIHRGFLKPYLNLIIRKDE